MDKLKSLLTPAAYILVFLICEFFLHYLQIILVVGYIASVALRTMEVISATGAIIELLEIAFGIEIKDKLKEVWDEKWKRFKQKQTSVKTTFPTTKKSLP